MTGVVFAGVLLASSAACSGVKTIEAPNPPWLDSLIARLESEPVADPPAYIARYWYRGRTVYYLPARCCDVESVLFDASGAVLCNPDGGIAGAVDGRCSDFFSTRSNERIIWRDTRTYP